VGGDLKSFAARDDLPRHLTEVTTYLHAAMSRLMRLDAPVVAAVHGSAAGAGLSLAAAADLVLAGASSRFVMAYTAIGLTPDGSGTWSLPRLVGLRRALELTLTNRRLSAAEAVQEGLATRVVPDDALAGEALALARSLAAGPTGALGAAKRLLRESLGRDLEAQMALETQSLAAAAASADSAEGIAAFLGKRAPGFRGQERW
jgi:2-(1,2-epoxy-1,2-dihydrophenyl)acetyl-CoA isomerase